MHMSGDRGDVQIMAYLKDQCSDPCKTTPKSCWHHANTRVIKQFSNGNWLIENIRGFVRVAATNELFFREGEYDTYRDPNTFVPQYHPDNPFDSTDPRRDLWETVERKGRR